MSVPEIEAAISELPSSDVMTFGLLSIRSNFGMIQIEADAKAGRLDHLIDEAKQEIRQGKASSLRDRANLA